MKPDIRFFHQIVHKVHRLQKCEQERPCETWNAHLSYWEA